MLRQFQFQQTFNILLILFFVNPTNKNILKGKNKTVLEPNSLAEF